MTTREIIQKYSELAPESIMDKIKIQKELEKRVETFHSVERRVQKVIRDRIEKEDKFKIALSEIPFLDVYHGFDKDHTKEQIEGYKQALLKVMSPIYYQGGHIFKKKFVVKEMNSEEDQEGVPVLGVLLETDEYPTVFLRYGETDEVPEVRMLFPVEKIEKGNGKRIKVNIYPDMQIYKQKCFCDEHGISMSDPFFNVYDAILEIDSMVGNDGVDSNTE